MCKKTELFNITDNSTWKYGVDERHIRHRERQSDRKRARAMRNVVIKEMERMLKEMERMPVTIQGKHLRNFVINS